MHVPAGVSAIADSPVIETRDGKSLAVIRRSR
jgi:hypothetical protein